MRHVLCAIGGMLMAFVLSGCVHETQGVAAAPPERCTLKGYEDVVAVSFDCGRTIDVPGLAAGWTARPVMLDDHQVMYLINKVALSRNDVVPPDAAVSDVREYAHVMVNSVLRYPQTDIVQIDVSEDCPLEKRYNDLFVDLGCSPILSPLGQQLNEQQAAIVLGRSMVDQIETRATDSGRDTVYVMSTFKLGEA